MAIRMTRRVTMSRMDRMGSAAVGVAGAMVAMVAVRSVGRFLFARAGAPSVRMYVRKSVGMEEMEEMEENLQADLPETCAVGAPRNNKF